TCLVISFVADVLTICISSVDGCVFIAMTRSPPPFAEYSESSVLFVSFVSLVTSVLLLPDSSFDESDPHAIKNRTVKPKTNAILKNLLELFICTLLLMFLRTICLLSNNTHFSQI